MSIGFARILADIGFARILADPEMPTLKCKLNLQLVVSDLEVSLSLNNYLKKFIHHVLTNIQYRSKWVLF